MTTVQLELEGMTCAACAARIEKALNTVGGVEASVNFATEKAAVSFKDERVTVDDLVGAVKSAGYGASLTRAKGNPGVRANDVSIATADDRFPNSTKAAGRTPCSTFYSVRITARR